jgi:hypothetical protein
MMADVTVLTFQDPENHGHHIHHHLLQSYLRAAV